MWVMWEVALGEVESQTLAEVCFLKAGIETGHSAGCKLAQQYNYKMTCVWAALEWGRVVQFILTLVAQFCWFVGKMSSLIESRAQQMTKIFCVLPWSVHYSMSLTVPSQSVRSRLHASYPSYHIPATTCIHTVKEECLMRLNNAITDKCPNMGMTYLTAKILPLPDALPHS